MSKGRKIILTILTAIILIPVTLVILLQLPPVQTLIANTASRIVSEKTDGRLSFGKVYYSMPNRLVIKGICFEQNCCKDTLLQLDKLALNVNVPALLGGRIHIKAVTLEDGQFNIVSVNDSTTNLDMLIDAFSSGEEEESSGESPVVMLDKLSLKNLRFTMQGPHADSIFSLPCPREIDWDNLWLDSIYLEARKLCYENDLDVSIHSLTFRESSGLKVEKFRADVKMTDDSLARGIYIKDLAYKDSYSYLLTDEFSLRYDDFNDFNDFCSKVVLSSDLDDVFLDFRTLAYYGGLMDNELKLHLSGPVTGTISNLAGKDMKVESGTGRSTIEMDFNLNGLPKTDETIASVQLKEASTDTRDIARILDELSPKSPKSTLWKIAPGERLNFKGSLDGMFEDMVAYGRLTTERMGKADVDIICRLEESGEYTIDGHVSTENLDLGRIAGSESLGRLDCESGVSATFGEKMRIEIDSLAVSRLGLLGYDYSALSVQGVLTDDDFNGSVTARDPNLDLDFTGGVSFMLKDERRDRLYDKYKFKLSLNNANLDELKLDSRDSHLKLNLDADVNVTKENVMGRVKMNSIKARLNDETMEIGDVSLRAFLSEGRNMMRLNSSFADATFEGTASIMDFVSSLLNRSTKLHMPNMFGKPDGEGLGEEYSLTLNTNDLKPVCKFLLPEMYISSGTGISIKIDRENKVRSNINSDLLAYGNTIFKDIDAHVESISDSLRMDVKSSSIDIEGISLKNDNVELSAKDNQASLKLTFDNGIPDRDNSNATINARVTIPESEEGRSAGAFVEIMPSAFTIKGKDWQIHPATIAYDGSATSISHFKLQQELQLLTVDGTISDRITDTLNMRMQDFDISMADALMAEPMGLKGSLTGNGKAVALLADDYGMLMSLKGKGIAIKNKDYGDFDIKSRWNEDENRFNLSAVNTAEGREPLNFKGYYYPSTKIIDGKVELKKMPLGFVEPMISFLATDIDGTVSANVGINGTLDKLKVTSTDGQLEDLKFKLDFTQVPYVLNGPFTISEKGIRFNRIDIADEYGKHGTISGGVNYDYFNDIDFNTRISLKEMLGLNTTSKDNNTFFGKAFATGNVRITGPLDKIKLGIDINTEPDSKVHVQLSSSGKTRSSLLTFVGEQTKINEYDSLRITKGMVASAKKEGSSELIVDVKVNATPDAEVYIDVNPEAGDVLAARGNGQIDIGVGGSDDFSIKGDYTVQEGSFLFNLMGITSKTFLLDNGGTISFNGDIMESDLNMTATYQTKASIGTLISDSTSVSYRRTVNCGIGITGKLSNPNINFGVKIPDLDPTTQSKVDMMLNTEDKKMRQVLALLVSGSFVPESESGIFNNTTILYSNASEIMASQLNNIFRQLDIPVDLGFSYQPTSNGRNLFDVAISTQLFNNRVTINGNIGNRRYTPTSGKGDFVGDVDVEVKLLKNGKFRLSAFSHSTDEYSNFLDQAQRNGIGINFQEEFDTFKELFRKIFWSKKRKEAYEQEQAIIRREQITKAMEERRKATNETR